MTDLRKTPLRRLLLLSALMSGGSPAVERIALGNPLTFGTDLARPLVSLEIPFTPKQTGTGDPSPQNIRSIVPWDGLKVFGGGKNLFNSDRTRGTPSNTDQSSSTKRTFDESKFVTGLSSQNDYITNRISSYDLTNGVLTFTATRSTYGVGFPVSLVAGSYTLSCIFDGRSISVAMYEVDGTFIGRINLDSTRKFTIPQNCMAVIIFFGEDNTEAQVKEIQLEVGNTATAYEPYKPITDTDIVFPSPVYGGTLDVVSGVLTVTHVRIEVKKRDFLQQGQGEMSYRQTPNNYIIQHKPKSGVNWSMARQTQKMECAVIANPYSETTFGNYIGVCLCDVTIPTTFRISMDVYDSMQNDDDSVSICYEIAEPFEIQLTSAQITALVGDNTIWSDADGSMTCVYLVSSKYADEHPVGGLGFGFGFGNSSDPDEPADPDEPDDPENPDEPEEPEIEETEEP